MLLTVALGSCSQPGDLAPKAYIGWVQNPDNGLVSTQSYDPYQFTLQYQPPTYLAILETGPANINKKQLDDLIQARNDTRYFMLEVSSNSPSPLIPLNEKGEQIQEAYQYLAYDFYHDIKLISRNDTVDCAMHQFEGNLEGASRLRFQLAFPKKTFGNADSFNLIFRDRLWSQQLLKFSYSTKDLATIPKPKL